MAASNYIQTEFQVDGFKVMICLFDATFTIFTPEGRFSTDFNGSSVCFCKVIQWNAAIYYYVQVGNDNVLINEQIFMKLAKTSFAGEVTDNNSNAHCAVESFELSIPIYPGCGNRDHHIQSVKVR